MTTETIENNNETTADTTVQPGADTTTTETADKPLSLRESLDANFELAEKGEQAPDLSAAAKTLASARKGKATPAKAQKVDAPVDDKAKVEADAKREAERAAMTPEQRAAAEAEDKKKAEATSSKLEAPTSWPAADREMFGKMPADAQQFLLRRHKEMETHFHKTNQDLAATRRLQEVIAEDFKPYREQMRLSGIDEAAAIRQLVAAHGFLQRDPVNAVKHLATQYGFDLKAVIEGAAAADPAGESPTVKALKAELAELRAWREQSTASQSQQQMHARLTEVEKFADEKDAQGNLKHPHFDEVTREVISIINASRDERGQPTISLQDAYDRAVFANPATRTKVLAAQDAERRAKEEAERKAKAEAARKAGFDVKGEGSAAAVAPGNSTLRESLERAYDAQVGRV